MNRKSRPGRDLEELVAKLEGIVKGPDFVGQELEIISPAFWIDSDTGEPREIDVSIGPKGAPPSACIMVECRDRGKRQDSMWLEQVEGKRRSLSPKHVIVVSRSGFTKPAMKKAAAWGIEMRLFEDLDPGALRGWLSPDADHMAVYQNCMVPDAFSLDFTKDGVSQLARGPRGSDGRYTLSLDGVVFVDSSNGRTFETKEAGYLLGDQALDAFKAQLRPNGGSKSWNIRLDIPQVEPLMLRTPQGDFPIQQLRFKLTMWLKVFKAPTSARLAYVGQDGERLQMVAYASDDHPTAGTFMLARSSVPNEDGSHELYLMYDRGAVPDTVVPPPLDSDVEDQ